jgi:hypothetical protein
MPAFKGPRKLLVSMISVFSRVHGPVSIFMISFERAVKEVTIDFRLKFGGLDCVPLLVFVHINICRGKAW